MLRALSKRGRKTLTSNRAISFLSRNQFFKRGQQGKPFTNMTDRNMAEMQFALQAETEELDLNFWWRVAQSRRWFIFTIAAITLALSTIHVLRLPNAYTARTKILVESMDQSVFQNPELLKPRNQY